nr:immunoglobulin light chain junction region [Macaca mulatta]
WQHYYSTPDSF